MREGFAEDENGDVGRERTGSSSCPFPLPPFLKNPEHVSILAIARDPDSYSFQAVYIVHLVKRRAILRPQPPLPLGNWSVWKKKTRLYGSWVGLEASSCGVRLSLWWSIGG